MSWFGRKNNGEHDSQPDAGKESDTKSEGFDGEVVEEVSEEASDADISNEVIESEDVVEEVEGEEAEDDGDSDTDDDDEAEDLRGPWDVDDDDIPDEPFLDLGGLKIPSRQDVYVRVAVSPQDQSQVLGVTAVYKSSSVQLSAIAAPKSMGLWDSIRQGFLDGTDGAQEVDGVFGKEVELQVPVAGQKTMIPARIVGVDGPRWMLRGIFTGPAARQGEEKKVLDEFFASTVVDRGNEPIAPRDPIPLTMPDLPAAQNNAAQNPEEPKGPRVKTQDVRAKEGVQTTLARGPMFSEVR